MHTSPGTASPFFSRVRPGARFSIPVRNRPFLAGSDHDSFPDSVPDASEMIPVLAYQGPGHGASGHGIGGAHGPDAASGERGPDGDGDGDAGALAAAVRGVVDDLLPRHGGVLLTGLPLTGRAQFERLVAGTGYGLLDYRGGIAVRKNDSGVALNASEEDHRITLSPHNEMAYLATYPRRIIFFCETQAAAGGEVPVNDIRQTAKLIPDRLKDAFREKGIRYHRHLPRESAIGEMGWVDTFGTDDKRAVERHLASSGYEYRWGDDDRLYYHYRRAAFVTHPDTGEELWFNQVTELHSSYWRAHPDFPADRPDDGYPATTAYGDGSPLDDEQIAYLRGTIWQSTRAVRMTPGDVLVLDNQVMQHGRFSFEGRRRHFVSLTR